ncbi:MAG: ABC transporter ATP-binding protein [Cellulomonadaceae bacterium]
MNDPAPLIAERVTLGYGGRPIIEDLDLEIPAGSVTVLIGPNGCGKSTLLGGLARVLRPSSGRVLLDGTDLQEWPTKQAAQRLAVLPQQPLLPDGITVRDLVRRGRHPHRGTFQRWSGEDDERVALALAETSLTEAADHPVGSLSGGQRQRAFIAMVLAQDTPLMLLDEPTTFLDIAHQYELLELCRRLNRDTGRTLVLVLHDLNQAARYATHIVALDQGRIAAQGTPDTVLTTETVQNAFGLDALIVPDPVTGTPMVVPRVGGDER